MENVPIVEKFPINYKNNYYIMYFSKRNRKKLVPKIPVDQLISNHFSKLVETSEESMKKILAMIDKPTKAVLYVKDKDITLHTAALNILKHKTKPQIGKVEVALELKPIDDLVEAFTDKK